VQLEYIKTMGNSQWISTFPIYQHIVKHVRPLQWLRGPSTWTCYTVVANTRMWLNTCMTARYQMSRYPEISTSTSIH